MRILVCVNPQCFNTSAPWQLARQFKSVGAEVHWILLGNTALNKDYSIVDNQLLYPDENVEQASAGRLLHQSVGHRSDWLTLMWRLFRLNSVDFDLVLIQGSTKLTRLFNAFGFNTIELGGWFEGLKSDVAVLPPIIDPTLKRRNDGKKYTLVYLPGIPIEESVLMLNHVEDRRFILFSDEEVVESSGRIEVRSFSHQAFRHSLCGASAVITLPDVNLMSECLHMGIPQLLETRWGSRRCKAAVASFHEMGLVYSTRKLTPLLISLWLDSPPDLPRIRWPDVAKSIANCDSGVVSFHQAVGEMSKSMWSHLILPSK